MHVVSETSEQDVAHARAFHAVEWALRHLTANLMRVAAGAGQSGMIPQELAKLVAALGDYREAVGCFPASWHMDRALDAARGEDLLERDIDEHWHTLRAERDVVVGSLRAAAARLLVQRVHIQASVNKMHEGVGELLRLQREREERWAAERRAAARVPRRKAKKRKPTTVKSSTRK